MNRFSCWLKKLRWRGDHNRIINGTRGVISLFLAILMVPFVTLTGALLDLARINSTVAIFDEILCNASNSTLGTYDSFLKKRFGLMALDQNISGKMDPYSVDDLLKDTFNKYMEESLGVLGKSYKSHTTSVKGLYPLSDPNVLEYQIIQSGKYSVPTRLIMDELSVESWIKTLENMIPGKELFDLAAAGSNTVSSITNLTHDTDQLKGNVRVGEDLLRTYKDKYQEFYNSVKNYVDKKNEMTAALNELDAKVTAAWAALNAASSSLAEYQDKISEEERKIEDYKRRAEEEGVDISQYQEQIDIIQEDIDDLKEEAKPYSEKYSKQNSEYLTAKKNYDDKKAEYQNALVPLFKAIGPKISQYSSAISNLSSQYKTIESSIESVQNDLESLGKNITSTVTATVSTIQASRIDAANKSVQEAQDKWQEVYSEESESESSQELASNVQKERERLAEIQDFDVPKITSSISNGANEGLSVFKSKLQSFQRSAYASVRNELNVIQTNVNAYAKDENGEINGEKITEYLQPSLYYYEVIGLSGSDVIEQAEQNLVGEIVKDGVWAYIKAVISFIEALLEINLFFDPKLSAVIDNDYYVNKYGGLPGSKDRGKYPLITGDVSDAQKSIDYQKLLGLFSDTNSTDAGSFDIIQCILDVLNSLSDLKDALLGLANLTQFYMIPERISTIVSSLGNICTSLKNLFQHFKNIALDIASYVANRVVVMGYAAYSTSDRTSWTKSNPLTNQSYDLRGQSVDVPVYPNYSYLGGIAPLIAMVSSIYRSVSPSASKEKCFYGAETEYLLFGSNSEIVNQVAAFFVIFALRIPMNIANVLKSAEIQSVAIPIASVTFGIGEVATIILFVLLESLVDSIILVNGGSTQLFKTNVYLTASGLPKLISALLPIVPNSAKNQLQIEQSKFELNYAEAITGTEAKLDTFSEGSTAVKNLNSITYSKYLVYALIVAFRKDHVLNRLSNIMEMESEVYYGKQMNDDCYYDLDKSFTYLRVQSKFETKRFLPIEMNSVLSSGNRVIYRGY